MLQYHSNYRCQIYRVGILTTRTTLINKKLYYLGQCECLSFLNVPTADRNTVLAVLISLSKCLGEVRCHGISLTPLSFLLGGLGSPLIRFFDNCILVLVICVLVEALSQWTFFTISWIFLSFFWLCIGILRNHYDREWMGWGKANQLRLSWW
jgi:hypothetical protein